MSRFKQVIVIGGTGQTGHRVLELFTEKQGVRLVGTSRRVSGELPDGDLASTVLHDVRKWGSKVTWCPLDLEAEPKEFQSQLNVLRGELSSELPTALVIAAAYTNVEGCETDPERCRKVNETNTVAALEWALREFNAKLLFYSTDYVFDGEAGPYPETSKRHAISRYGQSKVFVEEWVEKNASETLVLRTTGVFDYLPGSKNFLMQMLDLWGQGKTTRIPSDQYANPVCARDLAKATVELLEHDEKGIFHVAGGSFLARTEFAKTIARVYGFDEKMIEPILTSSMNQKARRPLKGGLKCDRLKKVLGWAPPPALDVLEVLKWERKRD